MAEADSAYNPELYLRGGASAGKSKPDAEPESDSAGIHKPGKQASVRLEMEDGVYALSYGLIDGLPWLSPDATVIEIPFHGRMKHEGRWAEPEWLARIEGKRLKSVFDHIAEHRRQSVKVTGPDVKEPEPMVLGIMVRRLEID